MGCNHSSEVSSSSGNEGNTNGNMATQETSEERENQRTVCCCIPKEACRCIPKEACCCIPKELPVQRPVKIPRTRQEKAERLCAYNEPIVDSKVFMGVIKKVQEEYNENERPQAEGTPTYRQTPANRRQEQASFRAETTNSLSHRLHEQALAYIRLISSSTTSSAQTSEMPARNLPVMTKQIGAAGKKNENRAPVKRQPQDDQSSDADSGNGTYFDRVLENSEDSYEESADDDNSYICDNCKVDEDDESSSEYESASPPRRFASRQPERSKRNGGFGRRQKSSPRPETSDYRDDEMNYRRTPNGRMRRQGKQKQPQRDNRREPSRGQKAIEYSDFDSDDDEYHSENSPETPRRRDFRQRKQTRRHPHSDAPPRRSQPQVVERKTTTRISRQSDGDAKIRRKPIHDDTSSESWSEPSEESEDSESYEPVEIHRRISRRPNRKVYIRYQEYPLAHIVEHFQYEDDERPKPQGRPGRARKRCD
ncbi:hypothetical protein Aperf_G00000102098 [Anoplocephala perfoliata]